jgi:Zincin-like metallopeptidase
VPSQDFISLPAFQAFKGADHFYNVAFHELTHWTGLLRAYSAQVEIFRRLRHGGQQFVRVEHVHVHDGGQAIIGNVKPAQPGASGAPEHRDSGGE